MLTNSLLNEIRKDMELALTMVEAKRNMKFKIGRMTYSSNSFKCSLEAVIATDGEEANVDKANWNKYAYRFGFSKTDFGKEFEVDGEVFTIYGIAPSRHKYPILAKCMTSGEVYKFPADRVKKQLAIAGI